jgi:hypothetical protein
MSFSATAKQRLWLECLGFDAASVDSAQASALFDSAGQSGRYKQLPHPNQARLAGSLGIDIGQASTCHEAAGRLYTVLLLRAWVYSVFRAMSGSKAATHTEAGLPEEEATALAREMAGLGMYQEVERFATADAREGDIWYRMGKGPQASQAYRFVADRLRDAPRARSQPKGRRGTRPQQAGCLTALAAIPILLVRSLWLPW